MNMLEIRELVADEWGQSEIYLLKVNADILKNYRDKYPEHVASVKPGDWVLCGFDDCLMYGRAEMVMYLAPPSGIENSEYKEEFNGVNDLLLKLNAA